jgi:hypothetical protein
MKARWMMIACLMSLSLMLLACSLASPAPATPSGGAQPIGATATLKATLPPIAPGTAAIPTRQPATLTPVIQASLAPTPTATLAEATATRIPVSSGPLDFVISVAGCRPDASREGGVILTLRFDASGGNGVYTYFRENQRVERTFERPATKGTAVIDSYRVESSDGQKIERKERFTGAQFGCP